MIVRITTFNFHSYNCSSYYMTKEKLKKKYSKIFLWKKVFSTFSLPPENPPDDRNSGIRSFTGPDGPRSASKTTGRTGFNISKSVKRPGQLEINFTGFLHTLKFIEEFHWVLTFSSMPCIILLLYNSFTQLNICKCISIELQPSYIWVLKYFP